jgi:molecular chaperone DnaJ
VSVCPECDGRGHFIDDPCPKCAGRGEVEREEILTVKVPPGIEEGIALRVPGRGLTSAGRIIPGERRLYERLQVIVWKRG